MKINQRVKIGDEGQNDGEKDTHVIKEKNGVNIRRWQDSWGDEEERES